MVSAREDYVTHVFIGAVEGPLVRVAKEFGGDFYRPKDVFRDNEKYYQFSRLDKVPYFLALSESRIPAEYCSGPHNLIVSLHSAQRRTNLAVRARFVERTRVELLKWKSVSPELLKELRCGEQLLQGCLKYGADVFFEAFNATKVT